MSDERATAAGANWTSLAGKVLEGGYEIQELLEADQSGRSFKIRVLGDPSSHALVNVFRAEGSGADEQIALWESAREFRHPNLGNPLAAGRIQADGTDLIYVVLTRADEALDAVLRDRPLSAEEAGEVLLSASGALDYLHANGFAHGCVSPEQVHSIGDKVKLSTECIRKAGSAPALALVPAKYKAPESAGENVTPEADVWCLGATLFEALTRKTCEEDCREQAARLPEPFGSIAPQCLDPDPQTRCKVAALPALYRQQESSFPEPSPVPVQETERARAPVRVIADGAPQRRRRLWIYAAIVFLLLCVVIWLALPKQPAQPVPVAQSTAPVKRPNAWPTQTLSPENRAPNSHPQSHTPQEEAKPAPAKRDDGTVNGSVWRVVLYTYSHSEDAQNMARSINEKHPQLRAEVFAPEGQSKAYLVVAGGRMTHDQAARLKRRVRSIGLPRDSYMQNYRQ